MIRSLRAVLVFCASAIALLAAVPAEGVGKSVRVLAPVDGAVIHAPDVLLVYTVPPETGVVYYLDGRPVSLDDAPVPGNDTDLRHVRVPLREGRQVIRLLDAADESEMGRLSLTYIPPYSMRTATYLGDEPYLFHARDREDTCSGCHSLPEVFETVPDRPLAPAAKVCGACHPRIEAAPNLHGPVAVYACFMCHEPQYQPSRFRQKSSQPATCGTCHQGFLDRVLGGKKFVHGPAAAGACIVCHDPHGGQTTALVRETPPDLCLLCHAETLPLPVENNLHGEIPCTRCHDPHGGQTPVRTAVGGNAFCGSCHADIVASKAGHPLGGHPVSAEMDPARPGHPMECGSCHGAHDPNDVSRRNIARTEAAQRGFCQKCHY